MKEKKLHMIGNAHIDPVWLWRWQEGFQEVKSTFRSALDRMEEYEDFLFTSSSAAFYEWVEKSDPGMFQEIRDRVTEGRWGIVGGWWIQPDCNIPGGESFVRQSLYGQRYFRERFGTTARVGVSRIGLVEHGPVKAILRVESSYGSSRLLQDFTVYAAFDRIDVEVTVDWREQFRALKLRFPVNLDFVRTTCEIPYSSIEREADSAEHPGQGWIDLSGIAPGTGETYGLSILNDGKYGLDARGEEVGLTVLRSPIYAHHDPFVPRPDESYSFVDQGIQRFTYALLPHTGSWEASGTVRHAAEINQRPVVLIESCHEGPLPKKDSYLSVEPDNVILEVLKQAEDGDDLIVRCRETCKKVTRATIYLSGWSRKIEADFAPCEIKTFRIPTDENLPVIEANLLEWDEPKL